MVRHRMVRACSRCLFFNFFEVLLRANFNRQLTECCYMKTTFVFKSMSLTWNTQYVFQEAKFTSLILNFSICVLMVWWWLWWEGGWLVACGHKNRYKHYILHSTKCVQNSLLRGRGRGGGGCIYRFCFLISLGSSQCSLGSPWLEEICSNCHIWVFNC